MLFNRWIIFGISVIFFTNFITKGECESSKSPTAIPHIDHDGQMTLNNRILLFDYIEMDAIRRNIVEHFGRDDYFFIGQPLAYVGLEMMVREELVGYTSGIIRLIPFSGSHIEIVRDNNQEHRFTRNREDYPTEQELENYKKLLQSLGLDPKSIIERYESSGNRTVIVQDVGTGLVSFLDILCSWAESEGMSPSQLRNMVKVFGIIFENNGFPDTPLITIGEFSVDLIRMELTSENSLSTIRRIAYPVRNTGYVRLLPDYPHQLWNEPPSGFNQQHVQRIKTIIDTLAEIMQLLADILPLSSSDSSNSVQRSDIDLVCRSPGPSRESRFKRDLSSPDLMRKKIHLILTSNEDVFKTPITEHDNSLFKSTSPWSFVKDQLKNSSSTVSKILMEMCNKYHYSINYGAQASELVHFSSDKTWIYGCIKRHWLFHCGEAYESSGITKTIANLAAQKFSGRIKTKFNVGKAVENLIYSLVSSYLKFPVDYVIEATKEAVLYCSDEKITPTMECPSYNTQYLGQIMFEWFI